MLGLAARNHHLRRVLRSGLGQDKPLDCFMSPATEGPETPQPHIHCYLKLLLVVREGRTCVSWGS